jgi:hypothetical protein
VLTVGELGAGHLRALFAHFGLAVEAHPDNAPIPGTFWGEPEAGLIGATLHVRADTPVHSALHEGAHFVCMEPARRQQLHTDAGGDDLEESAVCYLQIALSEHLENYSKTALLRDMDAWGYSFRLGSACRWFAADAEDARTWLERRAILPLQGPL